MRCSDDEDESETIWHITLDGSPATLVPGGEPFIHASFTRQLAETLKVHYPDAARVVLLRLDPGQLGERLVEEPSRGGQLFPHIYGEIEDADVLERVTLERDAAGSFPLLDG